MCLKILSNEALQSKESKEIRVVNSSVRRTVLPWGINYSEKLFALAGININSKAQWLILQKTLSKLPYFLFRTITSRISDKKNLYLLAQQNTVAFLIRMKHYKGVRRGLNLPLRGQRTHTNAKTVRRLKISKW